MLCGSDSGYLMRLYSRCLLKGNHLKTWLGLEDSLSFFLSFFLSVCLSIFLSFLLSFFFKAFDSYCHTALWRVLRFYIPTISDTCFLSLFGLPIVFFLFVYWCIVDVCIYLQSIFFVLVLRVQHNDSICVCVYTYILFQIIFPYRL